MTANPTPRTARAATADDVDAAVDTITTAFFHDPLWGPAFPDVEHRAEQASAFWRVFVTSSLRFPWTRVTPKVESVAVWIPPGADELTDEEAGRLEPLLVRTTGRAVADDILGLFEQFEAVRPSEPHFYLSLLATHTDHRGAGLGIGLLRDSLAQIDALGVPAYLESCNPANDARYQAEGFVPRTSFVTPTGHTVTTMWRPAA